MLIEQITTCRSPRGERGLKWKVVIDMDLTDIASLSSRRAWIEIMVGLQTSSPPRGRSPRGERGLKSAWNNGRRVSSSRSPRGERGLKLTVTIYHSKLYLCRSPRGERGLKSQVLLHIVQTMASLSSRRAWIEIYKYTLSNDEPPGRSPRGERGLKLKYELYVYRGF